MIINTHILFIRCLSIVARLLDTFTVDVLCMYISSHKFGHTRLIVIKAFGFLKQM